jgi:hypothetical protein
MSRSAFVGAGVGVTTGRSTGSCFQLPLASVVVGYFAAPVAGALVVGAFAALFLVALAVMFL